MLLNVFLNYKMLVNIYNIKQVLDLNPLLASPVKEPSSMP